MNMNMHIDLRCGVCSQMLRVPPPLLQQFLDSPGFCCPICKVKQRVEVPHEIAAAARRQIEYNHSLGGGLVQGGDWGGLEDKKYGGAKRPADSMRDGGVKKRPRVGNRPIVMKDLLAMDLVKPGKQVLTCENRGMIVAADLTEAGLISYNSLSFETPSAWSLYLKRMTNPDKKVDDGWKCVKYLGKPLEILKRDFLSIPEEEGPRATTASGQGAQKTGKASAGLNNLDTSEYDLLPTSRLRIVFRELYGTETTSNNRQWLLRKLAKHPSKEKEKHSKTGQRNGGGVAATQPSSGGGGGGGGASHLAAGRGFPPAPGVDVAPNIDELDSHLSWLESGDGGQLDASWRNNTLNFDNSAPLMKNPVNNFQK